MEKLELKHISPYLPYGLKVKWGIRVIKMNTGQGSSQHWIGISSLLKWYNSEMIEKPTILLRPLSDLVKPCLPGGWMPIIELSKFVDNGHNHTDSRIKKFGYAGDFTFTVFTEKCDDVHAAKFIIIDNKLAGVKIDSDNVTATTIQRIFEYLFANHFDVFSLIPAGLAVDVNSIEK